MRIKRASSGDEKTQIAEQRRNKRDANGITPITTKVMDKIIIIDLGSQYTHLIGRRIREFSIYTEVIPYDTPIEKIKEMKPKGIILSGGPASVYEKDAPKPDSGIFDLGVPVLGICYGLQLAVEHFGGEVQHADKREYGATSLKIADHTDLFAGTNESIRAWMSHGDAVEKMPSGFEVLASTENSPAAAIVNKQKKIYCVQFHPEVMHTEMGSQILKNFATEISGAKREWTVENFIDTTVKGLSEKIKNKERVVLFASGGVDSTVTAILLHRAVGDRLTCVFVDNGLLRLGEREEVERNFKKLGIKLEVVDAKDLFLGALIGVKDPEQKRKIIGAKFGEVIMAFDEESGHAFKWFAQGTLYPDKIESGVSISKGPAAVIKTHHNVGGLPEEVKRRFSVIEPVSQLYKDEVRAVGKALGLLEEFIGRHPFPGPGLAVRIVGEVTEEKLRIARHANAIWDEELKESGWYSKVWQAPVYVGDDKVTGVAGDQRKVGYEVRIKAVNSVDAMTATPAELPFWLIKRVANRITNEVEGVVSVVYHVSDKPPSTIEPQ